MPDPPDPMKRMRRNDLENPPWIRHRSNLPEEAVKLGVDEAHRQLGEPVEDAMELVQVRRRVEAVLSVAVPAIREQRDQELRERVLSKESVERIRRAALAPVVTDSHETLFEALSGVLADV